MFGDFGNDFTFMLQMMFFMVFYTDVMGINPAHVGLLFLLARLADAFTDVGMGRLVDTLKPAKSGRFKPWILRIAIPVSLGCRLFGNMLGGMIVVDLVYIALGAFGVGIPAVLGVYFNIFHPLIQTFIFVTLSLTFINEAVE